MVSEDKDTGPTVTDSRTIHSMFQRCTNFIDQHLREVRYAAYGIGVVGILVIGRSVRLTKRFTNVRSIPDHFITKHVRLHGCVKSVSELGILYVEHSPIFRPRYLDFYSKGEGCLPLRVSGVDFGEEGATWLQNNVTNLHIWFTSMCINNQDQLECIITTKKTKFRSICVNEELIRLGLGTVAHVEALSHDTAFIKFSHKLGVLQNKAMRRGVGIWSKPSVKERIQEAYVTKKTSWKQTVHDRIHNLQSWFIKKF